MYRKFGYATCAFFIMFVELSSSLLLIPSAKNKFTYMANFSWFMNTYGGQLGIYPLVADTLFKARGALGNACVSFAFSFSNLVILYFEKSLTEKFGNQNILYGLAVINLLPTFNILKLNKKIKEMNSKSV